MTTVITYGTYDLLHSGHIRLLERARALGTYLIVGVTATDFDKTRGKINVRQSLMERVEAVKNTGIADEVIIEEYEGQKIDDIKRFDVDIFTVGSDWEGHFDYLSEYCQVVYLDRTEGVSSTEVRAQRNRLVIGLVGNSNLVVKYADEIEFVNGVSVGAVCTADAKTRSEVEGRGLKLVEDIEDLWGDVDAVYVASPPPIREQLVEQALLHDVHVLCESPIALTIEAFDRLTSLAKQRELILLDCMKTAYSTAYHRLRLLVKSGKIGSVVSVQSTCTSLTDFSAAPIEHQVGSFFAWAPVGVLPVFQLLGTSWRDLRIASRNLEGVPSHLDSFTKIDFEYDDAVASVLVGKGIKSEGELVVAGTKGYVYVPAPWWKTEYFEIRFENPAANRKYFYQTDGEGIRDELVHFQRSIEFGQSGFYLNRKVSRAIVETTERFNEVWANRVPLLGS